MVSLCGISESSGSPNSSKVTSCGVPIAVTKYNLLFHASTQEQDLPYLEKHVFFVSNGPQQHALTKLFEMRM